jgi:hypothetical protein
MARVQLVDQDRAVREQALSVVSILLFRDVPTLPCWLMRPEQLSPNGGMNNLWLGYQFIDHFSGEIRQSSVQSVKPHFEFQVIEAKKV